jgi:uncharacterized protein HemY
MRGQTVRSFLALAILLIILLMVWPLVGVSAIVLLGILAGSRHWAQARRRNSR